MFVGLSRYRTAAANLLATLLIAGMLGGCSTVSVNGSLLPDPRIGGSASRIEAQPEARRRLFGVIQAARNLAQTVAVDPFLRPYSTVAAGVSVALKTAAGALRRTLLKAVEMPQLQGPIVPLGDAAPMDLGVWERQLDRLVGRPAWNGHVRFLIDGDEFFPRLTAAIEAARETVHVRTYIFDNDDVGVEIADLLRERSSEVEVRVLLDGVGTLLGTQVDAASMPEGFDTPLSMTRYLETGSAVRVRTHSNPAMTGDHVKSITVDGERAFIGSMNIGREYRYEWHDMMMEVTGSVVQEVQRDADKAWHKAGLLGDLGLLARSLASRARTEDLAGHPVRVLYTLPHDSQIYRAQLAAIRRVRSYIYIEQAYFSDDLILYELARARRRGVDVRVIIPKTGNHAVMDLSNAVAANALLSHGIRVYRYPGMSHIKAAVFDGWACVGSANFDALSLRINREMNLATSHPETVRELTERLFRRDFRHSTEVTEPIPVTWQHGIAELLADAAL